MDIMRQGLSVALDFPANTVRMRAWMRGILDDANVAHELHVLDLPDAVCLTQLHACNAQGTHPFQVSDANFATFTAHYAPPSPEEA